MKQSPTGKANKYQNSKKGAKPLIQGTTVLQILCGLLLVSNLWLLYGMVSPHQSISKYRGHRQQVAELEQKVRQLESENHQLFRQIQNFRKNPRVQEHVVREQLGWVRDDELVVEFVTTR